MIITDQDYNQLAFRISEGKVNKYDDLSEEVRTSLENSGHYICKLSGKYGETVLLVSRFEQYIGHKKITHDEKEHLSVASKRKWYEQYNNYGKSK